MMGCAPCSEQHVHGAQRAQELMTQISIPVPEGLTPVGGSSGLQHPVASEFQLRAEA